MKYLARLVRLMPALIAAGIAFGCLDGYAALRAGITAPEFKVVDITGQSISLEKYRGQVLILDFFATWCRPCRDSIPHLIELNRKYGKQGFRVLGMSSGEDGERAVKAFTEQMHITYPIALAEELVLADYGVRSVPVMFVIDKKGKVAEVYRGYSDTIGRSVEQLIRKLLIEK